MFLRNVLKFEIAGVDLSLGERETVRDSEVFEITEFEIAHSKWLKKQGQIQGKSYSVRDSREFEITEFEIAGFNCMYFSRSRFRERCVLELIIILSWTKVLKSSRYFSLWGRYTFVFFQIRVVACICYNCIVSLCAKAESIRVFNFCHFLKTYSCKVFEQLFWLSRLTLFSTYEQVYQKRLPPFYCVALFTYELKTPAAYTRLWSSKPRKDHQAKLDTYSEKQWRLKFNQYTSKM